MRFNNDRPIFVQIADHLTREIIAGHLAPEERLASARELGASLEVNPNTAARALQSLADAGVARCERGTGYFVAANGPDLARASMRAHFFETELPRLFTTMEELGIPPEELSPRYENWKKKIATGDE